MSVDKTSLTQRMEGFLNLLPIYIDDHKHEFDLNDFLETCTVHQIFDVHDVNAAESQHALGVMNSKLNDAETRLNPPSFFIFQINMYFSL